MRNPFRERLYGLSRDEYNELLTDQNGACAICGRLSEDRALAVDHDHASGSIRGLLCAPCNTGLGVFRDDQLLLQRAIAYLEAHAHGRSGLARDACMLTAADSQQLAFGFDVLLDGFTHDIEWLATAGAFCDTLMWTNLPDVFADRYDLPFAVAFLAATARVQERTRLSTTPLALCTAEELALTAAVKMAAIDARETGQMDVAEKLAAFLDSTVVDRDLLLLFDDGIGLSREQACLNGVTHLWFDEWFRPFSATPSCEKTALN